MDRTQNSKPAFTKETSQLVQIIEVIVNGKKKVQSIPLMAHQTIERPQ